MATAPHPQIQQRMAVQRMPEQFVQQNQIRGEPIRGPIGGQQMIPSWMPSGQPQEPAQYSIESQQQFHGPKQLTPPTIKRRLGPGYSLWYYREGFKWSQRL